VQACGDEGTAFLVQACADEGTAVLVQACAGEGTAVLRNVGIRLPCDVASCPIVLRCVGWGGGSVLLLRTEVHPTLVDPGQCALPERNCVCTGSVRFTVRSGGDVSVGLSVTVERRNRADALCRK
jgi:hypothetical protein